MPRENADLDHHTPADLLELHEVLEWEANHKPVSLAERDAVRAATAEAKGVER